MEQIKSAITQLEQSVLKLENAIHKVKEGRTQAEEKILQLKQAIRHTYDRLDKALDAYKKGEG